MEHISDNMQKYANHREQMGRLKKALDQQFYPESVFVEYAVMEDRPESVLRHSEKWDLKPNAFVSIDQKRKKVAKPAEEKKSLAHKYFSEELLQAVEQWVLKCNQIIHALMKKSLHTENLSALALEGQGLIKTLCAKTTRYNRALAKANQTNS